MKIAEVIAEDLTRRDLLKGAGALATAGAMAPAFGGEFQNWVSWMDPKTLDMWDKRWKQLSARAEKVFAKLKSMLNPEQAARIKNVELEVGEVRGSGIYAFADNKIIIDLSIFWDLGDDALAYTIAHEMGHVYYGHKGYKGQTTETNRNNELLADAFGAKLAYKAGYDPNRCFADLTEKEKAEPGNPTHPGYRQRVNHIKQQTGITVSHIKRGVDMLGVPMSQIAQA